MSEKLKRRFNTLCTWKGINMSDIAHELIEKWVDSTSLNSRSNNILLAAIPGEMSGGLAPP